MNLGKLSARFFCLSAIDGELSMRNRMSTLRLILIGMSLASTRPCSGLISEIDRSGQPVTRPAAARAVEARAAWRMRGPPEGAISIEQVADQVESPAVSNVYFSHRAHEP